MAIFANASSNSSQPANQNYVNTAQQIDLSCGPNFVNATIPASKSAARAVAASSMSAICLAAALALSFSLLL